MATALCLTVNVFVVWRGLVSFANGTLRAFSGSWRTGKRSAHGNTTAAVRGIVLQMVAANVTPCSLEIPASFVRKEESETTVTLPALQKPTVHRMEGAIWRQAASAKIPSQD